MSHPITSNSVMTGTFLVGTACLAFYLAWPLSGFTEVGLGSGFVPKSLAALQLLLGIALIVTGVMESGGIRTASPGGWKRRPLLTLVAIAFFGLTIERLGLAIALSGMVLIACCANPETKLREAAALAVGSAVVSYLVFVRALGLFIPLWPTIG
jgi:putative tricarboxylic transport membrane protein